MQSQEFPKTQGKGLMWKLKTKTYQQEQVHWGDRGSSEENLKNYNENINILRSVEVVTITVMKQVWTLKCGGGEKHSEKKKKTRTQKYTKV